MLLKVSIFKLTVKPERYFPRYFLRNIGDTAISFDPAVYL
jgi:hypothetical protein